MVAEGALQNCGCPSGPKICALMFGVESPGPLNLHLRYSNWMMSEAPDSMLLNVDSRLNDILLDLMGRFAASRQGRGRTASFSLLH